MRKSNLERLREETTSRLAPKRLDEDGFLKMLLAGNKPEDQRKILPTQRDFIYCQDRIASYMGAAGVAKTSSGLAGGLIRALTLPDSHFLVARHDYNKLIGTTGARLQEMLDTLPPGTIVDRKKDPPMQLWLKPIYSMGGEHPPPSKITFLGLKDSLGSYEFTDIFVDEADDCEEKRVLEATTRLRHVRIGFTPDSHEGMVTFRMAFNPPDVTHWLYTAHTGKDFQERKIKEPWVDRLFMPQPNENDENLPVNYHKDMEASLPEDMAMRLVHGQWGAVFPGDPVIRQFKHKIHVKEFEWDPGLMTFRFWDFGYRRPYCCWAQFDFEGRLKVVHEKLGENTEIEPWCDIVFAHQNKMMPGMQLSRIRDYGDPAVVQKKDTGQTLAKLRGKGITMFYQNSEIDTGIRLIRVNMEKLIDGEPALQFNRNGCPILIRALAGGYHMDETGTKPKKDGFYDHPVDAYRYGLINVLGNAGAATTQFFELPFSVESIGE